MVRATTCDHIWSDPQIMSFSLERATRSLDDDKGVNTQISIPSD